MYPMILPSLIEWRDAFLKKQKDEQNPAQKTCTTTKDQIPADVMAEKILEHFGREPQMLKAIEELNECAAKLAKDLIHIKQINQGSGPMLNTIEEIADATIMLRQMRLLYGWELVDEAIERKLQRTERFIVEGLL